MSQMLMGTAIFEIIFNRDMDVSNPLRANFGPDDPFKLSD